jgi:hypothetical protein
MHMFPKFMYEKRIDFLRTVLKIYEQNSSIVFTNSVPCCFIKVFK